MMRRVYSSGLKAQLVEPYNCTTKCRLADLEWLVIIMVKVMVVVPGVGKGISVELCWYRCALD